MDKELFTLVGTTKESLPFTSRELPGLYTTDGVTSFPINYLPLIYGYLTQKLPLFYPKEVQPKMIQILRAYFDEEQVSVQGFESDPDGITIILFGSNYRDRIIKAVKEAFKIGNKDIKVDQVQRRTVGTNTIQTATAISVNTAVYRNLWIQMIGQYLAKGDLHKISNSYLQQLYVEFQREQRKPLVTTVSPEQVFNVVTAYCGKLPATLFRQQV